MTDEKKKNICIAYKFVFENQEEKIFKIELDPVTRNVIRTSKKEDLPDWTKSENFSCGGCNLDRKKNIYCPVAVNIKDIIDFFSDLPSFTNAKIFVLHNGRQYFKKTSIQVGVSSIIGILMASSGCPTLAKMKPLVQYHLPFSSLEETEFRVLSMYLLAQYFKKKNGLEPDWELKGVKKMYEDIQKINQNVAKKIADLEKRDTSINAVVVLNNFADFVSFSLDEMDLDHIEELFNDYLK